MGSGQNYDHYSVLGVTKNECETSVLRAFLYSVLAEHPDRRGGTPKSGHRFLAVVPHNTDAFGTLSDPKLRTEYDVKLATSSTPEWVSLPAPKVPPPSWPKEIDIHDLGLFAAYTNILVDAYVLDSDKSRRLPMLAGVPPSLVSLLASARDLIFDIPEEKAAKQFLDVIVTLAEREFRCAAQISRRAEQHSLRSGRDAIIERASRDSEPPIKLTCDPLPQQFPPSPKIPVRELVSILERTRRDLDDERDRDTLRKRRHSRDSLASTTSKRTKKVTFDDAVYSEKERAESIKSVDTVTSSNSERSRRAPSVEVGAPVADRHDRLQFPIATTSDKRSSISGYKVTSPVAVYDSPDEVDDALSEHGSDYSDAHAIYFDALDAFPYPESPEIPPPTQKPELLPIPALTSSTTSLTPSSSLDSESTAWSGRDRDRQPSAGHVPRLVIQIPDKDVETATPSTGTPPSADETQPSSPRPPSTTSITRSVVGTLVDKVKLPEKLKKPFSDKLPRSPSFLMASLPKVRKSKQKPAANRRHSYPAQQAPRRSISDSIALIPDEDFNAITRRPGTPLSHPHEPDFPNADEITRIVNSQLKPSRFLEDPHRFMDEAMAFHTRKPLHQPPRRAPTVRSSQSSAKSIRSEPVSRSSSVMSFPLMSLQVPTTLDRQPQFIPTPLTRASTASTLGSFYAYGHTPSEGSPVSSVVFNPALNRSSQSLQHHLARPRHHAQSLSTSSRRQSFFKRMKDLDDEFEDALPPISPNIESAPKAADLSLSDTERSSILSSRSGYESDVDVIGRIFSSVSRRSQHLPSIHSPDVATPHSTAAHKPLPPLPPHLARSDSAKTLPVGYVAVKLPMEPVYDGHMFGHHVPLVPAMDYAPHVLIPTTLVSHPTHAPSASVNPSPSQHSPAQTNSLRHSRRKSCPSMLGTLSFAPEKQKRQPLRQSRTYRNFRPAPSLPEDLCPNSPPEVLITPPTPSQPSLEFGWMKDELKLGPRAVKGGPAPSLKQETRGGRFFRYFKRRSPQDFDNETKDWASIK